MFQTLDWSLFFSSGLIFSTKPGFVVISWGKVKESKIPFKETNLWSFFCPDFYLNNSRYLRFEYNVECQSDQLLSYLKIGLKKKNNASNIKFSDLDFNIFEKKFYKIQKEIKKNVITKAVPVVFQKSNRLLSLLEKKYLLMSILEKNIIDINQCLHIYGLFLNNKGILGSSPEILFSYKKQNKILKSMALAGTALSSEKKDSLLNSDKDLKEHKIVSEYLNKALSNLENKNNLTSSKIYEKNIGYLKHLCKDFQISIDNFCLKTIINLLHPTPALGTSPKDQWNFLKTLDAVEHTTTSRLNHGAPFVGISPNQNIKAIVSIRNIQWTNTNLYLFAGCGIISESNLQKEFQELNNKTKSTKLLLGI
ncbi:MAG: hypothetical protein HAW60_04255 [Bdellovibrionales bacterium]|nr:hypothetical protein [Bdellovibrionales bacterium]